MPSEPVAVQIVSAITTAVHAITTGGGHWFDLSDSAALIVGDPSTVPAGPDTLVIVGAPRLVTSPEDGASLSEYQRTLTLGILARTPSGDDTPATKMTVCLRLAHELSTAIEAGARNLNLNSSGVLQVWTEWEQIQGGDFATSGMAAISGAITARYTEEAGI